LAEFVSQSADGDLDGVGEWVGVEELLCAKDGGGGAQQGFEAPAFLARR
jgi:hypothetical protein